MKTSSIISRIRWAVLFLGVGITLNPAEAGNGRRPSIQRLLFQPQAQLRNHYRPSIKVTAVRRAGSLTEISCEFNARAGFVDRVELRVGGKVQSTKKFDQPVTKGDLKFKVDLSGSAAGRQKVQLWVWQGRQGYRTVHGESKKISITH